VISLGVHAALLAVVAFAPLRPAPVDDLLPVEVELVAPPMPEPVVEPSASPAPPAPEARPLPVKLRPAVPASAPIATAPVPSPEPAPVAAAVAEVAPLADGDGPTVASASPGEGVAPGPSGAIAAGPPKQGLVVAAAPPARPLTEVERRKLVDRYLQELLRTRIRDRFRYPAEARELELAGQVLVRLTLNKNGHLMAARLAGTCPHPLLCDDGIRTVRESAPFPSPPAELGDSLQIEIPLNYAFDP
jgi:protein TonB